MESLCQKCRSVAALRRFRDLNRGPRLSRNRHAGTFRRALLAVAVAIPLEAHPVSGGTWMVGACKLETIGPGFVTGVADARTLLLEDGREARLAGIEVGTEEAARAVEDLKSALAGRAVMMRRLGPEKDRYGRLLVHLFAAEGGTERWIQADLVARGNARAAARIGDRACSRELLAREAKARAAKLGMWAEPNHGITLAQELAELTAERGRFAIVEGKVLSVRESGNTIFVNFGRKWTEDFVVTIAKRHERAFAAAGLPPMRLQGRRLRVRGVVEQRGGPWIEATHPEQIELLDGD